MKITADTNVPIRAAVQDEPHQAHQAAELLRKAELIAVPVPVLCEFVWVLRRGYKRSASEVSDAIHRLMKSANAVMNRPAIEAGLASLEAGGDFADGQSLMRVTGWGPKSLFRSIRKLSPCCSRKAPARP